MRVPDLNWPADLFADAADGLTREDSNGWLSRLRRRVDALKFAARVLMDRSRPRSATATIWHRATPWCLGAGAVGRR